MDALTLIRILAHLGWVLWIVTALALVYAARGKPIYITHIPLMFSAGGLAALWVSGLLLTVRGAELLPRGAVVPVLAALEFSGMCLAWVWLVWCGRDNFSIELGRNDRTTLLIVALATVIFLA